MKWLLISLCVLATTTAQAQVLDWLDRFEGSILRFEEQPKPEEGQVVVTGNSNIVKWASMKESLAPLPVVARGFGGSTTEELLYYLDRIVLAYKPRAVVIHEGENDYVEGYSPSEIAERHADVIARIKAENASTRVYVIGLKPSPRRVSVWDTFQETNSELEAMCAVDNQCLYIPPPADLLDSNGQPREELYYDRLHLNEAGYEVWNAAIAPVILDAELGSGRIPRPPASFDTTD